MLKPVARIGDLFSGNCANHDNSFVTGVLISGAGSVSAEGARVARMGDFGISSCGCLTMIISGAPSVYAQGAKLAHQGSKLGPPISGSITGGAHSVKVRT